MKKSMTMAALLSLVCLTSGTAFADGHEWGERGERGEHGERYERSATVTAVTNKTYETECSACHFAYQPGFLPERSWVKIMENLDNHFGDNATLDQRTHTAILNYLRGHAADQLPQRFSGKLLRSISESEAPLRITGTGYFVRKHDEIPARMVKHNPQVKSFSNCLACHSGAGKGFYDEDSVKIPGYGRWED